ncbi:MAG: flavodoxin family protein [Clostridia bacterium]
MKILFVFGRLKERGALEKLAEELRRDGVETEIFSPLKTESLLCSGCGACKGAGMCVADPRGHEFLKAAGTCDGFLFVSSGGLLGLDIDMKNLLERAAALTKRRDGDPLAGKRAAALLLCRRGGRKSAAQMAELLRKLDLRLPESGELPVFRGDEPEAAEAQRTLARELAGLG